MKIRYLIATMLAICLLCMTVAGCGDSQQNTPSDTVSDESTVSEGNDSQDKSNSDIYKETNEKYLMSSYRFSLVEYVEVRTVPEDKSLERYYTQRAKRWFITHDVSGVKPYTDEAALNADLQAGKIEGDKNGKIFIVSVFYETGEKEYYAVRGDNEKVIDTVTKVKSDERI